jgi:tetratricopeptide (TPR) repeat protein
MVALARGGGAAIALIVPASNLKDCSPFKSEGPAERDASENFARARTRLQEKRFAEAHEEFVKARDEDVCPLRASSALAANVREVAAARGVPLVDFEALLAERMLRLVGHESPGAEYFLDHVHPTIEANRLLAVALAQALASAGIVARVPDASQIAAARHAVESGIDERAHGRALRRVAKVLSWAGKAEEAARLAEQADAKLGGDAESRFIMGGLALARRENDRAAALFASALELGADYARAHVNLGVAFARLGRVDEARTHYDRAISLEPTRANAWFDRGVLRRRTGDLSGAISDFEHALSLEPDDVDARFDLGLSLLELNRPDEAAGAFREVLARQPYDADALRRLADALRGSGQIAR